jgi:hypothetical protein
MEIIQKRRKTALQKIIQEFRVGDIVIEQTYSNPYYIEYRIDKGDDLLQNYLETYYVTKGEPVRYKETMQTEFYQSLIHDCYAVSIAREFESVREGDIQPTGFNLLTIWLKEKDKYSVNDPYFLTLTGG